MIGPILNMLNYSDEDIQLLSRNEAFNKDYNIFGTGTENVTITETMNAEDLYNKYKTLEFANLTINNGVKLTPKLEVQYRKDFEDPLPVYSVTNHFHPFILKCSGTLTVLGELTAQSFGGGSGKYAKSNKKTDQVMISPIKLVSGNLSEKAYYNKYGYGYVGMSTFDKSGFGWSANSVDFFHLMEYGRNGAFATGQPLFLIGGGAGCYRKYKKHYKSRWRDITMSGFACGGFRHGSNIVFGCAGGCVILYFRHLIIDGKEYGKEPCDVTRVSASGLWTDGGDAALVGRGGGCMIIAADTIKIGPKGTINADGYGAIKNILVQGSTRTYYINRDGIGTGKRICPSFLNNPPALKSNQLGTVWDVGSSKYVTGFGENVYYFDDGTGFGQPNCNIQNDADEYAVGGAGIALGYKIN